MKTLFKYFFASVISFSFVFAQSITAEKILNNVKSHFDNVKDYQATITATFNIERLHIPPMQLTFFFKQPNKTHIESKNFAMLPREGFGLNPSDLLDKFDATLESTERTDSGTYYKLRLISKPKPNRPPSESFIWVDGSKWAVSKMETSPVEGRRIEVNFDYTLVDGKYLLPSSMNASFDFSPGQPEGLADKKYRVNRMPSKGSVEIRYSDYKVNSGLSDELFKEKKKEGTEN